MTVLRLRQALVAALLLCPALAYAAEIAAPFVPTAPSIVERMLDIAKVGPNDYVVDLGSGDGRIIITAAKKYGARGFGVDIDSKLVALANANARAAAVGDRAKFYKRDLFETDLSDATVVTIYLLKRATMKLRSKLLTLKPGTRIVSHAASMGEWPADHFEMLDVKDKVRPDAPGRTYIHFWVVPVKMAGTWCWSMPIGGRMRDYELSAVQEFQTFAGIVRVDGKEVKVNEGRLTGEGITLAFAADIEGGTVQHRFAGRVTGDSIIGTASVGGGSGLDKAQWNAIRAEALRGECSQKTGANAP